MSSERLYLRLPGDPINPPDSTVPSGTMQSHAIREELAAYVEMAATYQETIPAGTMWTENIVPDGAARLIVEFDVGSTADLSRRASVRVVGPSVSPMVLSLQGHMEGLSLTFHAGAVPALFDISTRSLADHSVSLDELWGPGSEARVGESICRAEDARARSEALQAILTARLKSDRGDRPTARAIALLRLSRGDTSVPKVAAALGLGERRLQQLFAEDVGLTPRTFRRVARLQACIKALRGVQRPQWSRLASELGFYDQAHLTNEFRTLSGLTPTDFLRRRFSGSSKTAQ